MKPEELRIGNYFKWMDIASMGRGIDKINCGQEIDHYLNLKEPIPLTSEWLEKFGFKEETNSEFVKFWSGNGITDFIYHEYYHKNNDLFRLSSDKYHIHLDYVHSLQNLYFCLKEKELQCGDIKEQNI